MPEIEGISAGGMPDRVKCLHVLAAHALAAGPGVNPFGDEVLELLGDWWRSGPCVTSGDAGVTRSPPSTAAPTPIKLLIGDLPDVAVRENRMVRLGQGVDATGRLAPEALERAFAAIDEYAVLISRHGVERIRFCATSATRDAENAAEFTAGVRARLGIDPEVLSGDQEARLAFDGALRGIDPTPEPVLVFDVGGGSTELILGVARPGRGRRTRWTSGRSASTSGASAATRRPPTRSPPAWRRSTPRWTSARSTPRRPRP